LANPQSFSGRPNLSLAISHSVSGATVNWSVVMYETSSQPTWSGFPNDNSFVYDFSAGGGPSRGPVQFVYDFRPEGLQTLVLDSGSFTATSSSFTATAFVSSSSLSGSAIVDQVINATITPPNPTWQTGSTLPVATRNTFYSRSVTASPVTSPAYSLVSQSENTRGLSFSGNTISGTPTSVGVVTFTVRANNNGSTSDRTFSVTINPALPVFSDASINNLATRNVAYSDSVSASETESYSVRNSANTAAGTLPDGLTLTTTGVEAGTISGTPTTIGITSFRIRATNVTGSTDTESLTIDVRNNLGKRQTSSGFQNIETSRRFDGTTWIQTTVSKRFDGTNWVDVSNS
jgi:hypothetical protein